VSPEAENLPPIRFSLGGRAWQYCVAVASISATYALIFDDRLKPKSLLGVSFALSVAFIYLSFKKARVVIFADRVEFTDFHAKTEVIKFPDIAKVELRSGNRSVETIITTRISGQERQVTLPYVYKTTFYAVRSYLQKWHGDPLAVVHALSDGSLDRNVWNAPSPKAT